MNATDKTYIIAEAGVNHNGDLNRALQLVEEAAKAGADAVKFQTFIASEVVSRYADRAEYQIRNIDVKRESQLDMVKKLELKFQDFGKIKIHCDKNSIEFLTTPFDTESVDYCDNIVTKFKIASGELTNHGFLKYVAIKGKPIILSTGMSTLGEVEEAVDIILSHQTEIKSDFPPLSLLHCTTNYPCPVEEVNLKAMITLRESFKLPVGYSDHTVGIEVPVAAVTLGATIIEKHFTLEKNLPGPDHQASLEPHELKEMIRSIRNIELAMGDGIKKSNNSELEIMKVARKSIVARYDLNAGTKISEESLAIKRPATGIAPRDLAKIIGLILKHDKKADESINWEDFKDE